MPQPASSPNINIQEKNPHKSVYNLGQQEENKDNFKSISVDIHFSLFQKVMRQA